MTELSEIQKLVNEELEEANKKYPLFHSDHEAYAVIKEEIEECTEELECLQNYMKLMWKRIREDGDIEKWITLTKKRAMNLAAEAIQVAAMCDKTLIGREK